MTKHTPANLNNHVVAVIDGHAAIEELRRDLYRAGFEDSILFEGEEIARDIDPKGEHAGPLRKLVKSIEDHLSEETNYLAQYQEEARAGHHVIALPAKDRADAERAAPLLIAHGARNVRFFGRLAVADLSAPSNPSARSVESPEPQSTV